MNLDFYPLFSLIMQINKHLEDPKDLPSFQSLEKTEKSPYRALLEKSTALFGKRIQSILLKEVSIPMWKKASPQTQPLETEVSSSKATESISLNEHTASWSHETKDALKTLISTADQPDYRPTQREQWDVSTQKAYEQLRTHKDFVKAAESSTDFPDINIPLRNAEEITTFISRVRACLAMPMAHLSPSQETFRTQEDEEFRLAVLEIEDALEDKDVALSLEKAQALQERLIEDSFYYSPDDSVKENQTVQVAGQEVTMSNEYLDEVIAENYKREE